MKTQILIIGGMILALTSSALGQATGLPGNPEDNGLLPKTPTFYINTAETINNARTESLGVAIASNGNVIIGWEDDGDGLSDLEAVWTLYSSSGNPLTPDTMITTIDPSLAGQELTSKFLSYFRKDGTAISGRTSWGPKIKANPFGDGIGMGATAFDLGIEVVELAATQFNTAGENAGDFPAVQLLTNDGQPLGILSGLDEAFAERDGDVRIGDWDYLSNGNIVIVGESRQRDDLADKFGGAAAGTHAIYRIVDPTGKEVKAVSLVSETPDPNDIWHGVGVTKNGFAVRFNQGGARVRFFDNNGTPVSTNIIVAEATGKASTGGGGRGDGAGFHGNGNDALVLANTGPGEDGVNRAWVTVFNENGTVRWSALANDDVQTSGPTDRVDAAIDSQGRVLAVFDSTVGDPASPRLVQGRWFDAAGNPLGGTFLVSELETPDLAGFESRRPRVAMRGNLAAIVWESQNSPDLAGTRVVSARLFSTFKPGTLESAGLTRIVPDTPVNLPPQDHLGNWEPYISILGNSVFLLEANTFAEGSATDMRYVVAFQPVAGGAMKLGEGFFADDGTPYNGSINASRQNGNPGRVAGDKRPGAVNFIVGGEASPHAFSPAFTSDNRWSINDIYSGDNRYTVVQTFALNPATLEQRSLSKAFDAVNGQNTAPFQGNVGEVSRFGGDLAGLDNGNFAVVIDDRSNMIVANRATTVAIIKPDGQVVKPGFAVEERDLWSNVAAHQGGFCVRVHQNLHFYDNNGEHQGVVDQAVSGEPFDTGRGDGTRIAAHINSPYVFLAGKVAGADLVKVAAFDSRDRSFAGVAIVSEPAFAGSFDRVNLASDALDRVTVAWVSQPAGYGQQQVAARVLAFNGASKSFTALTPSFLPFINAAPTGEIRSRQMSVAMTTKQICIAAKGEINLENKPENGANSPRDLNFYTVFSHPDPKDDPTAPASGGGGGFTIASATLSAGGLRITWSGGTGPYTVQKKTSLADATWVDVMTTAETSASLAIEGATGFFRIVGR